MTTLELEHAILHHEAEGHPRMIVTVQRKREPSGRRIRVLPGVIGTWLSYAGGTITVEVATVDLRRFLDRRPAPETR